MKAIERLAADPRARGRKLTLRYHLEGLGSMSRAEVQMLLQEKRLFLADVRGCCERGEHLHINVVLARSVERDIREISGALKAMEREPGPER